MCISAAIGGCTTTISTCGALVCDYLVIMISGYMHYIHYVRNAAGKGLLFIVQEQDFMNVALPPLTLMIPLVPFPELNV